MLSAETKVQMLVMNQKWTSADTAAALGECRFKGGPSRVGPE